MNNSTKKFNDQFTVGQSVHLMLDDGGFLPTYLESEAWELADGTPVAKVAGKRGGWSIDRIFHRDADC